MALKLGAVRQLLVGGHFPLRLDVDILEFVLAPDADEGVSGVLAGDGVALGLQPRPSFPAITGNHRFRVAATDGVRRSRRVFAEGSIVSYVPA